MAQVKEIVNEEVVGAEIIPLRLAIMAMRDSGYKNTAYALAELIDNAIQADASMVEVLCLEQSQLVVKRKRRNLYSMAVIDNGSGMDRSTLRMALQFGNGTRLNDRSGIGRFGMGLPNASISQTRRVDVWSWQTGPDNAIHTYIDLDEIGNGAMRVVPEPELGPVPREWRELSRSLDLNGTLVVWSKLELDRLTWKSAKQTLHNTERLIGRIYRRFIKDGKVEVRLFAKVDKDDDTLLDRLAVFDDPLYLNPSPSVPKPFDSEQMFEHVFDHPQTIEYDDEEHTVMVRYSVARDKTITMAGIKDRGKMEYGQHAASNIGVSVLRAEREIMLDQGWCIGYDPRERWWGAEVQFPPALDELFGVTNNKQAAIHFSELATTKWEHFAEEGEQFIDVVKRLKEHGDPRGWLLQLADEIKRNLEMLRNLIKAQGAGRRSTNRTHRNKVDDVTIAANKGWKERAKEKPVDGENQPTTKRDLEEIRNDLTKNKRYSESDAADLVSLIEEAKLQVVFLELDFPNRFDLFNVETKGNITEVTFNRLHPAFDDIFGTADTSYKDISELSKEEIRDRLVRAVNATKITFAAWARYEREAGIDQASNLQKVRYDWGQIAATFLQPEDDSI